MSDPVATPGRLETITGDNWRDLIGSERAVLVLGKTGCAACGTWSEELEAWLGGDEEWKDVRFGKMILDSRGLTEFKKENRWLADLDVLPYNVVYQSGEKRAEWAGGGRERLENRLRRLFR